MSNWNSDIKEGPTGGLIADNTFDSTGLTGADYADSWVGISGNGYTIRNSTGRNPGGNALRDEFQTHVQVAGWGPNNVFDGKWATVNAPGYVINIQASGTGNVVRSTSVAIGAAQGLTNIAVTP